MELLLSRCWGANTGDLVGVVVCKSVDKCGSESSQGLEYFESSQRRKFHKDLCPQYDLCLQEVHFSALRT